MKQYFQSLTLAASISSALLLNAGCQNKEALKALQDLTTQLSSQITSNNEAISAATNELTACKTSIAEIQKVTAAPAEVVNFQAPTLADMTDIKALEAHKQALTDVITKQTAKITEIKTAVSMCAQELLTAKAQQEAEQAKEAQKKPVAKKKEEKPVAVQNAEKEGIKPTEMKSRYKKKTN